jgi:hypothetical protein
MQISAVGLSICIGLLLAAYYCRGVLIIGLVASLAFGATALMTLSSLGSSSPLIYTFFAGILVVAVAARRRIWQELGNLFGSVSATWALVSLMAYAVVGAWLFPRFFAGQTSVFVQSKTRFGVIEASLAPVSANISQTGYLVLGGLTSIALCVLLMERDRIDQLRRGLFLWCGLHAGMGLVDLIGKLGGAGDVLAPIRTASYAMLTDVSEAGFSRIAGAYSEASAFGSVSLSCLALCYSYWRMTRSPFARLLTFVLLFPVIISTSSTAYVGLAILCVPVALSVGRSLLSGRMQSDDILIMVLLFSGILVILAISLYDAGFFNPFIHLIETTVINKASSSSGQERTYWNLKSLQSFLDTGGLGVGFGSSRASSWPIAVLSQLGLVGSLMMATLLVVIARGLGGARQWVDAETDAVATSTRNCALASVVSGSLAAGSANPGMIFFIAFAVLSAARMSARRNRHEALAMTVGRNSSDKLPAASRPGFWAPGASTTSFTGRSV